MRMNKLYHTIPYHENELNHFLNHVTSSGAPSSRKSSVSTAAPEVKVTKPVDKDGATPSDGVTINGAKPKSLLQLLPVRLRIQLR